MSDNETMADIVRELRKSAAVFRSRAATNSNQSYYEDQNDLWMASMITNYCDRIEAAAKRNIHTDNTETLHNALAENERLKVALREILGHAINTPGYDAVRALTVIDELASAALRGESEVKHD